MREFPRDGLNRALVQQRGLLKVILCHGEIVFVCNVWRVSKPYSITKNFFAHWVMRSPEVYGVDVNILIKEIRGTPK